MAAASALHWFPDGIEVEPEPDTTPSQFFTPAFMQQYTRFETFEAFIGASPWSRGGAFEESGGLPRGEVDRSVARTTEFDHWTGMRNRTAEREVRQRLLL